MPSGIYKRTEETRRIMSDARKGSNNPMYGKKISEKHKTIISKANKGKILSQKTKDEISKSHIGMKLSPETLEKISGKNNYNWKGGVKLLREKIRALYKYRQWRSDIFERDNYTCQDCGMKGGTLNADHIKSFAVILDEYNIKTTQDAIVCEELWNINNGRTLCVLCHRKTNTWGKNLEYQKLYE
jgi:hypothetical protein